MVRTLTELQTFIATWRPIIDTDPVAAYRALEHDDVTRALLYTTLTQEGVDPAVILTSTDAELSTLMSRVFSQLPTTETAALKALFAEASITDTGDEVAIQPAEMDTEDRKVGLETTRRMITQDAPTVSDGITQIPTKAAYARALGHQWVKDLAEQYRNEAVFGTAAAQDQAAKELARVITSVPPQPTIQATKARIKEALPHVDFPVALNDQEVEKLAAATWSMHEVARKAVRDPEMANPQTFTRYGLEGSASIQTRGGPSPETILEQAQYQAAADRVLAARVDPQRPPPISFEAVAKGPFQKVIAAPIANAVSSFFPKAKEAAITSMFARGVTRVLTNTELLQERLGADVVSSGVFAQFAEKSIRSSQSQQDAAMSAIGGVNKLVANSLGQVFKEAPSEAALAYAISVREHLQAQARGVTTTPIQNPNLMQLYHVSAAHNNSHLIRVIGHQGADLILQGVSQKLLQAGAREGVKKWFMTMLGQFGLGWLTGGASWVTSAITWIGSGLVKSLLGVAIGVQRARSRAWYEDDSTKLIVAVIGGIAFMVAIPIALVTVTKLTYMKMVRDRIAMVLSAVGGDDGQSTDTPPFDGPLASSDITGCPTVVKPRISYCPFANADPGAVAIIGNTHAHADAYDIAVGLGSEVRATHDGTVTKAGPNGGYGIMVAIRATDSAEKTYETWYGHLKTTMVNNGDTVKTGQLIGFSDSTGNVFGAHLHYEYRLVTGDGTSPPPAPVRFLPASCGYPNPLGCKL